MCLSFSVYTFFLPFQQIPNLDEVFQDINKTVTDTSVLTDQAKTSVNDSYDTGVQNISFTQYTEQVKGLVIFGIKCVRFLKSDHLIFICFDSAQWLGLVKLWQEMRSAGAVSLGAKER